MILPTLAAWLYFVALSGSGQASAAQQFAYALSKVVQFAFPLAFVWLTTGWPGLSRPTTRGLGLGAVFGLLTAAAMFALYFAGLLDPHPGPPECLGQLHEIRQRLAIAF